MTDRTTFEDALIADMRANGGVVSSGPLAGHPLLVLTSRGARTGAERRAILTFSRDAGDLIVAGTASGSPRNPAWVHNLEQHPDAMVEEANRTIPARATVLRSGAERDRLWQRHVERLPWFADYPAQAGRVIPVVRLSPMSEG